MNLLVVMLLLIVSCIETFEQNRRRKVNIGFLENCTGCVMCAGDNGCTTCQPKLFLLIWREGIRQYGACVLACPAGYFGERGQDVNKCIKCKAPNCESCFSKEFCMQCKEGFYLFKGKCFSTCPEGTIVHENTRECIEECDLSPWTEWSLCIRSNKTCGFKWGLEKRTRQIIRKPAEENLPCPPVSEERKCRMRRFCPGEKNDNRRKGRRDKNLRKANITEPLGDT
ncbi:R-spondin-4 [Protopterus annectens]|uniref:R-spondin-4 n=1 Tax=Protopterus annectens TaxID=7888 RepID=UPI001CF93F92|nr:R-spondin-4 [Protopterus annectens]